MNGLDVPSVVEDNAGVLFADEASICASGFAGTGSQFLAADDSVQDLKSFFSRPTLVSRGSLSATTGPLYGFNVSWTGLISEVPNWASRLLGVRGLRADLVFTIEHSCNPFHQGLLVGAFQYGTGQFSRSNKAATCTHLPHVRLNVSHNTSARLVVPYLSEFEYFGSSASEAGHIMGTFNLVQVLPTPALTNSNVPVFKVFLHLENIQLFGRVPVNGTTFVVPQSGVASKPSGVINAERELAANGQFSGVLATAAKLPTAIGRAFPTLRPFMGSATWFLNAAAKAASAFGFSKPIPTAPLVRQMRFSNYMENVCDVAVPASVVGGFQGNSVAISDALGGTDIDEMAFDSILTRYSQIFRGSIATTDTHSTVVYCGKTCLMHYWFRAPSAATPGNRQIPRGSAAFNSILPSNLTYFGQHFRYWHGDLKYRVTFAKSKFHTGRVMFSFIPDYQQVSTANTYDDVGFAGGPAPGVFNSDLQPSQYSIVFDLKDGSEFEFDVPFIAPVSQLGINDCTGFVSMQIMDPLVNNGESASSISFIVEVAAAPGFYFAGVSTPGQPAWPDVLEPAIEFQSGVGAKSMDASQFSVGEKFTSLKQLMMIPTIRRYSLTDNTTFTGVVPFWTCLPAWGNGAALAPDGARNWAMPRCGMVAQCYAYGIGSTLLYWSPNIGIQSAARVQLNERDNNTAQVGTVPSVYGQAVSAATRAYAAILPGLNQGMFMLPMLSGGPRFRMGDFNTGGIGRDWDVNVSGYTTTSNTVKAIYNFFHRNNDGVGRQAQWGICAADDARCAAYIGPCPMVLSNSATTSNSWWSGGVY